MCRGGPALRSAALDRRPGCSPAARRGISASQLAVPAGGRRGLQQRRRRRPGGAGRRARHGRRCSRSRSGGCATARRRCPRLGGRGSCHGDGLRGGVRRRFRSLRLADGGCSRAAMHVDSIHAREAGLATATPVSAQTVRNRRPAKSVAAAANAPPQRNGEPQPDGPAAATFRPNRLRQRTIRARTISAPARWWRGSGSRPSSMRAGSTARRRMCAWCWSRPAGG